MEDETMERVYDSEEEYYLLRPKTKTKHKTEPKVTPKILLKLNPSLNLSLKLKIVSVLVVTSRRYYLGIKLECKECHAELRNKIALTTDTYSHNRRYLENTEYFEINCSQNMKEFFITDKAGNYIEDLDEAINNSLEEIKNCYQYRKVKSYRYKITADCEYKKRTKEEVKTSKILFITDYIVNNAIYENGDFPKMAKL